MAPWCRGHYRSLRSAGTNRQYNVHPLVSCIRQSVDEKFKPRDDTRSTPAPDFNVVAATLGTPCGLDEINQTLEWAPTVVPTLKSGVWGARGSRRVRAWGLIFSSIYRPVWCPPKLVGVAGKTGISPAASLAQTLIGLSSPHLQGDEALPQFPLQPQRWRFTMSMLANRR